MAGQPPIIRGALDESERPPLTPLGGVIDRPGRGRVAFLTIVFTPVAVVAALPVTAVLAVVASVVANVTTFWVGFAALMVAGLLLGYVVARMAAGHQGVPATRGVRRWLPLATSIAIIGLWAVEIASGSHAPDPVIVLCLVSLAWIVSVLPLAGGDWGWRRWTLWIAAPSVTFAAIVFVATQGLFSLRFAMAVSDFDEFYEQGAELEASAGDVGGFTVHTVHRGERIGGYENCDTAMWITGWHEADTRYIAHCSGTPVAAAERGGVGISHLSGDWWEIEDRPIPPELR